MCELCCCDEMESESCNESIELDRYRSVVAHQVLAWPHNINNLERSSSVKGNRHLSVRRDVRFYAVVNMISIGSQPSVCTTKRAAAGSEEM